MVEFNLQTLLYIVLGLVIGIVIGYYYLVSKKQVVQIDKSKIISNKLQEINQYNKNSGYIIRNNKKLFKINAIGMYKTKDGVLYHFNCVPLLFWEIYNPLEKLTFLVSSDNLVINKNNYYLKQNFVLNRFGNLIFSFTDNLALKFIENFGNYLDSWVVESAFLANLQRLTVVDLSKTLEVLKYEEKSINVPKVQENI
jgi:uncharacterized membrane protein SpoIIM required for sporulation